MSDKMQQFQNVMVKIMGQAIREQKGVLGREIGGQISDQVLKEIDYQFRLREDEEERRFQKLDEAIRAQQKSREEIAAAKERRRFFKRRKKDR